MKFDGLRLLSMLMVTVLSVTGTLNAAAPQKLNVLMIAVDDMRPQLGCYGDKTVKSPCIDKLASEGLVFDRAYVQMALCSPSRIALLSGLRPSTTGIYEIGPTLRSKAHDVVTLPQHFKNHGYETRSLGKVFHVGIDDPESWSVPSFHSKKPRYGNEGQQMVAARRQEMKDKGIKEPAKGKGKSNYAGPAFESPDCADDELLDGDTAREAIEIINNYGTSQTKPFFLAVGFANPHVPWVAPKKYWDLYESSQMKLPANRYVPYQAPEYAATSGNDFAWYHGVPEKRPLPDNYGRDCLHGYLAAISYIDAQVGKILTALENAKLRENTIVILWSDHGYYMGEHEWWGSKHNTYEGATRACLMISIPGQQTKGQHSKALIEFMDIYPTLAELCGLEIPKHVEGTSFKPLISDPQKTWKTAAFSEYPKSGHLGRAMRTDRFRYVTWTSKKGMVDDIEVYDHQTDPEENQNIASTLDPVIKAELEKMHAGYWQGNKPKDN